jgi:hypothetical protein
MQGVPGPQEVSTRKKSVPKTGSVVVATVRTAVTGWRRYKSAEIS